MSVSMRRIIFQPNFKSNVVNSNTHNLKIHNDSFINTKSDISFTSYKGWGWYGVQEDRDNLRYKIQLTPEKIDHNIRTAHSPAEGIVTSLEELGREADKVDLAGKSMDKIFEEFREISNKRVIEIRKMNPAGSTVPVIGFFAQMYGCAGSFIKELAGHIDDLNEDKFGIIEHYFDNGMKPLTNGFVTACDHLDTRAMHNMNGILLNRSRETISKSKQQVQTAYKNLDDKLTFICWKLTDAIEDALEYQGDHQVARSIRKAVTFGLK